MSATSTLAGQSLGVSWMETTRGILTYAELAPLLAVANGGGDLISHKCE
jgi:hypothetical protein